MNEKNTTKISRQEDHTALLTELEEWRVQKGYTKAQLARELGLRSAVALFYWNKGTTRPYPRNLFRIKQLLGKPMTAEEFSEWNKEIYK